MKIVFLQESIYDYASGNSKAVGGAERQQWLLGRALAARGWSVAVGVQKAIGPGQRQKIEGVEFIGLGQDYALLAWSKFLFSTQPDWCYWRGADHVLGPLAELAKAARVKMVFSTAFDSDVNPRRALFRRTAWWRIYAWGLIRSDRICVQHPGQLSALSWKIRRKASIVPSIVAIPASFKSHFDRPKYVAWIAMLRQPKRPDLLLEIAKKAPQIQFVVCGAPTNHRSPVGYGDSVKQALQQLPNVDYRGQVAPKIARGIIANAAVYLLTSDEEGLPNTFLEACSSGTPVVSLKVDPNSSIKRLGLGALCPSIEGAVTAIHALIDSPSYREEIALRARNYVAAAHDETAAVTAFESAIAGDQRHGSS